MKNTRKSFYGQQEGERILFVVRPHSLAITLNLIKIYLVALVVLVIFLLISRSVTDLRGILTLVGVFLALIIALLGTRILRVSQKKDIAYITDRRVVRFEPTTIFATNVRTLPWDEIVKVKTFPPNILWKMMAIGTVVVHARTTVRTNETDKPPSPVTADDIEITNVYYYRDLGNYLDKILFTYKKKPKDVKRIKPFVPKPKGQRD